MILRGKDLVVYKLNQIVRFGFMIAGTLAFTAFMMLMAIVWG